MANTEVAIKRRRRLPLENALQTDYDRGARNSEGNFKSIEGFYLINF